MPSWKFIPWILEFLQVPLRVKEKPPPTPESETDDAWSEGRLKGHKEKKKKRKKDLEMRLKAEAEAQAAKADRAAKRQQAIEAGQNLKDVGLEETEEEIEIPDVPIDWLIPAKDENGNKYPIEKFILIGFPQTETHCQKLKEYGLDFDRVLFLKDGSEEDPGKELTERMNQLQKASDIHKSSCYDYENWVSSYDYEAELATATAILDVVKEHMLDEEKKDEIVKEIDCSGSIDDVFIKIRTEIDPFFIQADNPEDIKASEEYEDEEKKRIQKSDFGDYCPVTYVDSQFLVKGSEEKELFVHGKRYLFAGDEELEKFKFEP